MARRHAIAVVSVAVLASLVGMTVAASGVSRPEVPKGQGASCVEDVDFMRRNHMDLLNHQRDKTVLRGIRTERHSLKGCVDCHAVAGPDERPVTATSPEHFCRSCHDYAAVKIDCFQCHASRPETTTGQVE